MRVVDIDSNDTFEIEKMDSESGTSGPSDFPTLPQNIKRGLKSQLDEPVIEEEDEDEEEDGDSVTDLQEMLRNLRPDLTAQSGDDSVKIAVFLRRDRNLSDEGASYIVELENDKKTTAADIKLKMMELLSLPEDSAHIFAVWFVSPYLSLQLKPQHQVNKIIN